MVVSDEYRGLDEEMLERRNFYLSQVEQYPLLDEVICGRAKFSDRALQLEKGFWRTFPRTVMILRYGGFLKEVNLPSIGKLMPFAEVVSDLSGEQTAQNVNYQQLLSNILCDITDPYSGKIRKRLKHFFLALTASAVLLDRDVKRTFLDVLVQENPEAFKEEYSRMKPEDREYAEYTLSRMLGAGILDVDEIELERIVLEARESARSEKDDTE